MAAHWQSPGGPRPDAEACAGLPVLTPGVDRLPTRCTYCPSTWLESEPPTGPHQFGMLWCRCCSRSLCWLAAPLTRRQETRSTPVNPVPSVPRTRPLLVRSLVRTDGCGPACSLLYGHCALTHEAHGAAAVRAELELRASGPVATGRLVVDAAQARVEVDGAPLRLTGIQFRILAYLASRLGEVCRHGEITTVVWDASTADYWQVEDRRRFNTLRTHVFRLRARLGAAAALVETVPFFGYRLIAVEATS